MTRGELHRSAGVVHTEPHRLRTLVLSVRPGPLGDGSCWLLGEGPGTVTGGPDRFTVALTDHAMTVDVTPTRSRSRAAGGTAASGPSPDTSTAHC